MAVRSGVTWAVTAERFGVADAYSDPQELIARGFPLSLITHEAGFSDQSHFSNLFRQHTGLSPFRFRRAVRSA